MLQADTSPLSVSFFIPRSRISTLINKTGTWRFARPAFENKTAPCSAACPAGEDIARIELLVARREYRAAWETIVMENPFPGVCGRVCFHPCESRCNRAALDESLGIHQVERFVADQARCQGFNFPEATVASKGKKIGIIGAGPAGLAAAFFLTRLGHTCEVLEADSQPGGLLRWGIPAYRLPPEILDHEITAIEKLGVQIACNTPVNPTLLTELRSRVDAVFVGCGLSRSLALHIPGADLAEDGLAFLAAARRQSLSRFKGAVAVIGGGNTAVDVARSLKRLGADPVIVYRRRREDMPAFAAEVAMAVAENIPICELLAPVSLERGSEGLVLHLQPMKAHPQPSGRAQISPADAPEETLKVTHVFTAIGAEGAPLWLPPGTELEGDLVLSHCRITNRLNRASEAGQSTRPIVFGGDLTNSIQSVTDAIASGKQAALALDVMFREGRDRVADRLAACRIGDGPALSMELYLNGARARRNSRLVPFEEINMDYFSPQPRVQPQQRDALAASADFAEIETTLDEVPTLKEAGRCFNCGLCNDCDNCRVFCPEVAVKLNPARRIDLDYCKGCGICVVECPRNALTLEEETP